MDIILLHGALGDRLTLLPLAEMLKPDFNVFAMDFGGHAGKQTANFSMDGFAAEVADLIRSNGLVRPAIFGYSMGGYTALTLAAAQPGTTGPIFTLATKFDWTAESAAREARMLDADKIREKVPAFAEVLEKRHGSGWKTLCQETARMISSLANDPEPDFASIDCPVMISVGELDKMVSIPESQRAADAIPNGAFHLFPTMAHAIEGADVREIAARLRTFLK